MDLWDQIGKRYLSFIRHLNDWEMDNVEEFFSKLQGMMVNYGEDEAVLADSRKDNFIVKVLYVPLAFWVLYSFFDK